MELGPCTSSSYFHFSGRVCSRILEGLDGIGRVLMSGQLFASSAQGNLGVAFYSSRGLEALVVSSPLSKVTCLHCAVWFCFPSSDTSPLVGRTDEKVCIASLSCRPHDLSGPSGGLNSSPYPPGPVCPAAHTRLDAADAAPHLLQAGAGVRDTLSWGDVHYAECCVSGG